MFEAKLVLVGEGEVGKTCLREALLENDFIPGRPTTHGIEVRKLVVEHPEKENNYPHRHSSNHMSIRQFHHRPNPDQYQNPLLNNKAFVQYQLQQYSETERFFCVFQKFWLHFNFTINR